MAQRPAPTGAIVQVGLAPLVLTTPVQSPCSVNPSVLPVCENVSATGVAETLGKTILVGLARVGAGLCSGGGFVGIDEGTGVGEALPAGTATTANQYV